ncbi:MAG: hypothetical protein GY906_09950 [bacterium]|nr:hypothetical protein [bacterium]
MTWTLVLVLIVTLGVWSLTRVTEPVAFFAASRRAGAILAGLGGTAAGLSAFAFVGGPGLFASLGVVSLWIILSAPFTGVLQCWVVGEPIVELTRTHGCLTVPELVAARFGRGLPQLFAGIAVLFGCVATLAVQLKGLAVLGDVLLGWESLVLPAFVLTATLMYTATGGMRVGLLVEAVQGAFMAFAALIVAASTLWAAGGPSAALSLVAAERPELLHAWTPNGEVVGLGWMLLFFLGTCAQPHYLQKFLFLRDRSALRWMPMVMTVSLVAVLTVWIGVGLGGAALIIQGDITLDNPDQLAPAVLRLLGGPLMTLAAVAVVAAVMSTMTSLLTLSSAALSRDLPAALGCTPPSRSLTGARAATILTGLLAFGLAFLSTRQVGLLGILGWGMFTSTLLPVMILGLRWRGASRSGALLSMASGAIVCLAIELLRFWQPGVASGWEPGLSGAAMATVVLVIASWCRPQPEPIPEQGGNS